MVPVSLLTDPELLEALAESTSYLLQLIHSAQENYDLGEGPWARYGAAFADHVYTVDVLLSECERRALALSVTVLSRMPLGG